MSRVGAGGPRPTPMDGADNDRGNVRPMQRGRAPTDTGEGLILDGTRRIAEHFQVKRNADNVERLLSEHAALAPDAALRRLANEMGIEDDDQDDFIDGLKEAVATSTAAGRQTDPTQGLTEDEDRYLELRDKDLDAQAKKAQEAGKGWRRGRLIAAGSVAAYLGFATSALVGKMATYGRMPMPFEMINISGVLTLMGSEIIGGKLRSRAGGYGAHDSLAWKNYNTCISRLKALGIEEAGKQSDRAALRSIQKIRKVELVKLQNICIDLLRREFGQELGMKKTTDHGDVPDERESLNPFLKNINTKLQVHVPSDELVVGDALGGGESTESTVEASSSSSASSSLEVEVDEESEGDDGVPELRAAVDAQRADESKRSHELRMPDGTPVFTIEAGATAESFKVTWPGEDSPRDLCTQAVAKEHVDRLMRLAEPLANAAWWRAMLCDENPFIGFSSVLMAPGTLTPIIQSTMPGCVVGATIDTVQAVGFSHLGLVLSYLEQDRLRGKYGGANPGKVANTGVNAAAYKRIDWLLSTVGARAEVLADMKTRLSNGRHYLLGQQRDLNKILPQDKKALARVKARIGVYEKALKETDEARRSCVKQRKALLKERQAVEGVATVLARTWRDAMSDYVCVNPVQFAARVFSYSLPFLVYSNLWVPFVMQPLRPVEFNATTGLPHDKPFGMVWLPYMALAPFYGFVIQLPYQFRNLGIGDNVEHVARMGGAYGKRGYNALMNALACGRHEDVETGRYDEEAVDDDAQSSPKPARKPVAARSSKPNTTIDVARLPLGDSDEE
ncbi:MAG: hypothetical protein V4787_06425 [Pseudomonadota bacterium]